MKKKILAMFFGATLLCACTEEPSYQCIAPLPPAFSLDSLDDVTVPAEFSLDDFDWDGNSLTLALWSMDLYDAVQVSQMKPGDTLVYRGEKMLVSEVEQEDAILTVNKGLYEGGAWLTPQGGGVYRAVESSDCATYTELGSVTLPIADGFRLIYCGEDYNDPSDTVTSCHRQYLESKVSRSFWAGDTDVRIVQGKVVSIHKRWTP